MAGCLQNNGIKDPLLSTACTLGVGSTLFNMTHLVVDMAVDKSMH